MPAGRFSDLAGFDALHADPHRADAAVEVHTDPLEVRDEPPDRYSRDPEADASRSFRDTAPGDSFSEKRFFEADVTRSCHGKASILAWSKRRFKKKRPFWT